MNEDREQEQIINSCCSAAMIPVGFFIAAVIAVGITLVTGILDVDLFTAALYVVGLQVLFLALFTVAYAIRGEI
jgi:type IV secretory pathway VirB2 component (pilin)